MDDFLRAYNGLNEAQKKAVDTIDGPVMVVAGPGTGKTQVLALRIATILTKTDTPPDGVLCLTFTNAGVKAMRERLMRSIGAAAMRVRIATFHSFGIQLLEKYYSSVGFPTAPILLDDATSVALLDELFHSRQWQYLRPRTNPTLYFRDLKSLISLLKRERIAADTFRASVAAAIAQLEHDPESISSRGDTKGQLKKEVEKKIESLKRSLEVADFYELYEEIKTTRTLIDYNDVLELMVRLVEESDEVRDYIREQFLYVLIDEHQDSSGIQNEFLAAVWKEVEQPNIFVVGDDRQLIYGFGGASLAYFEGFKHAFGTATLITLTDNYRSTQTILDSAETLLTSTLAQGKLVSQSKEAYPLRLVEAEYPRDEIIAAGLMIKEKIEQGTAPEECVILVPKNRQVKAAAGILKDMGLPVAADHSFKLFELSETDFLLNVLKCTNDPYDHIALSQTLLNPLASIPALSVHRFLHESDVRTLSLSHLLEATDPMITTWGEKLAGWVNASQKNDLYALIQLIGEEIFLASATDDATLRKRVEIIRTTLNLVTSFIERGQNISLSDFLKFINRLKEYGEDVPLAVFGAGKGIKVLTLHGSKGLEFDLVWIAHMDEKSLMGNRRQAFALPLDIEEKIQEHDEEVSKRQLYVAITRAKRFCVISYATHSHTGTDQQLAPIIASLPQELFVRSDAAATEASILSSDPTHYVAKEKEHENDTVAALIETVAQEYLDRNVSVTLLNNFFDCPWKWYFRNILQLPELQSESLHLGNVVHKSIEFLLKNESAGERELKEYLIYCTGIEARYDESLAQRLLHQAEKILLSWQKLYQKTLVKPFEIERALYYRDPSLPELSLYGKIDVVEELSPGAVRVTDWKTGSVKTKAEVEKKDDEGRLSPYLRQLAMYAYLIESTTNGGLTTTEERLVFVEGGAEKNAIVSRKVSSDDIALLRKDIKDYKHFVETGEWVSRPCNAKTYGENDICEYCAMAHTLYRTKKSKTP